MKGIVILCVLAAVAGALARPSDNEHYTDKFDGIDLDEILGNRRLLVAYVNCVLEKGKCTAEGKELKLHLREALETDCAKCTTTQRNGAEKVFRHLIKEEPKLWEELKAKYDPTGKYSKKYETELKKLS